VNKTRFALLGLLAERPYSGYEIRQIVGLRFALFWKESYGQIYPELKRLVADGLAEAGPPGLRGRTEYRITGPGRRALADWVKTPADEDQVRSEALLKIYFSAFGDEGTLERLVADQAARARRNLAWLSEAAAQLAGILDADPTHGRALAVVRLGLATEAARLAWAESELSATPRPGAAGRSGP